MSHENVELCDAESAERISDVFCSESNMRHLRRGISQRNAGKGIPHELIDPNALTSRIGSSIASQTTL